MPPASDGAAENACAPVGAVSACHAAAASACSSVAAAASMLGSSACTSSPGSGAENVRAVAASCSTMIGVASTDASSYPYSMSSETLNRSGSSTPAAT